MTHVLVVRRERQGRKLRRCDMCFFFFFFFFVVFQISLSSSASVDSRRHFVSPPRKALIYATTPFRGPLSRGGDIYGEDKRVVHTGPNPLHN
uniref:CLAVATA3/ESR (CLE)-related protein 17 n=1 Tax=Noccaea caerulescens TaxID=107243 RepID=A0A1J3I7Z5_NOCCA